MKLTITTVKTKHVNVKAEYTFHIYDNIQGLQKDYVRPQTVELNREELAALIQNPKLGLDIVSIMGEPLK